MECKTRLLSLGVPALLVLLLTHVSTPTSVDDDRKTIPEPEERHVSPAYNVPENFVVTFDEHILVPEKDLTCNGRHLGRADSRSSLKSFRTLNKANCEQWPAGSSREKLKAHFLIRAYARMTQMTEFLMNTAGSCAVLE